MEKRILKVNVCYEWVSLTSSLGGSAGKEMYEGEGSVLLGKFCFIWGKLGSKDMEPTEGAREGISKRRGRKEERHCLPQEQTQWKEVIVECWGPESVITKRFSPRWPKNHGEEKTPPPSMGGGYEEGSPSHWQFRTNHFHHLCYPIWVFSKKQPLNPWFWNQVTWRFPGVKMIWLTSLEGKSPEEF